MRIYVATFSNVLLVIMEWVIVVLFAGPRRNFGSRVIASRVAFLFFFLHVLLVGSIDNSLVNVVNEAAWFGLRL